MRLQSLLLLVLGASMGLASPVAIPDSNENPRNVWRDDEPNSADGQRVQPVRTYRSPSLQRSRQDRNKLNVVPYTEMRTFDKACSRCSAQQCAGG
ncbi:MAG: hypothetical protein M1823_004511, partial [Watsoniomyces obsoletus]